MQCIECDLRSAETVVAVMNKLQHLPFCADGVPEKPLANEMGLMIKALGGTAKQPLSCDENKIILIGGNAKAKCSPAVRGAETLEKVRARGEGGGGGGARATGQGQRV